MPCYCYPCERVIEPIQREGQSYGHCPICGRSPGVLERRLDGHPKPSELDELAERYNDSDEL